MTKKREENLGSETILNYLVETGKIDLTLVQEAIIMEHRKEILRRHPYRIWQGANGYWFTYLPDGEKGRRLVKKKRKEALEDQIIVFGEGQKEDLSFKARWNVWTERQRKCGVDDNTLSKYESDYRRFFEGDIFETLSVPDISDEDIGEFLSRLLERKEIPYRALKAMFGYMKNVFDKCIKDKIIEQNPCEGVDLPLYRKSCPVKVVKPQDRVLLPLEKASLLASIRRTKKTRPAYIVQYAVEFSLYAAMRVGELSGLKWEDIDFNNKIIVVQRSEKYNRKKKEHYISLTKTEKIRIIPLTDEMKAVLDEVKAVEMKNGFLSEFVFSDGNGRVHASTISDCVRNRTMNRNFTKPKSIHAIRRTVNSDLRGSGMSATVAASLLGHSPKVNDSNYTYDTSQMDYKRGVFEEINRKTHDGMAQWVKSNQK